MVLLSGSRLTKRAANSRRSFDSTVNENVIPPIFQAFKASMMLVATAICCAFTFK